MNNAVDRKTLEKAPIASACFMGLGQILYLKQYVRGALYALVEVAMLCAVIFGTKKIIPANQSEADDMLGLPDIVETIEYLEEQNYPKIDGIKTAMAGDMEKFLKKYAPEAAEDIDDFGDVYAVEDVVYDLDDDTVIDKFDKLSAKYTTKLAKIYARISPEDFDANYDAHDDVSRRMVKRGVRTTAYRAWFRGPIVTSIAGLITLGRVQDTQLSSFKDHSIFMMINGILALIMISFFVFLYILNITSAKTSAARILKNGRFPTLKEAQDDISQNSFATIGIAPSVVMIAIFCLVPLLFSALVAFTNYSSPDHIPPNNLVDWVGLENFGTMFSSNLSGGMWAKAFGYTAAWTIVWAIFATFTCFFVGFFYAFVLQDRRIVIPKFFRTVYIFPYAIPQMLSLFVWANILNGTIGPINRTFQLLGLISSPIPWLSSPMMAKFSLIFVNIWIGFPYSMILTTSSMTAISNSLYEAAVIDGASKWEQFKSITYPLVMFQLKPTLIMQFAGNINNFGAVFFLTGGGPNMPQAGLTTVTNCGATDLLISWIFKLTMNTPQRYNLASVLSLLVFVVLVPFALYNFTRTKSFQEGQV